MQAQLAAIERAITDVADIARSMIGKLDDRFQAELSLRKVCCKRLIAPLARQAS